MYILFISVILLSALVTWARHLREGWKLSFSSQRGLKLGLSKLQPPLSGPTFNTEETAALAPSLVEILSRSELFQYIEEEVIEQYARNLELIQAQRDKKLPIHQYAICFVLKGSVNAYAQGYTNTSEKVLKLITRNQCLTPALSTLSLLLKTLGKGSEHHVSSQCNYRIAEYDFYAAESTTLATLPTSALDELVGAHPDATLRLIDNIIRRAYSATFPFARDYLALDQDLLDQSVTVSTLGKQSWTSLERSLSIFQKVEFRDLFTPMSTPIHPTSNDSELKSAALIVSQRRVGPSRSGARDQVSEDIIESPITPNPLHRQLPDIQIMTTEEKIRETEKDSNPDPSLLAQIGGSALLSPKELYPSSTHALALKNILAAFLFEVFGLSYDVKSTADNSHGETPLQHFRDQIELLSFREGSTLAKQGERFPGLFILVDGTVTIAEISKEREALSHKAHISNPGALLGLSTVFSNERALFNISAQTNLYPKILLGMAEVLSSMPTTLQYVHFATDWLRYEANQIVYKKGSDSNCFYVVGSGRLRSSEPGDNKSNICIEFGRGQSFGSKELYASIPRLATVRAVRQSHVIQFQRMSFRALAYHNPELAVRFSEVIAKHASFVFEASIARRQEQPDDVTIQTVAVISLNTSVSAPRFAKELVNSINSLKVVGDVAAPILDRAAIERNLSSGIADVCGTAFLENYLVEIEDNARLVLYVSELDGDDLWSNVCVAHADLIIFLKAADASAEVTLAERRLAEFGAAAQKRLVLVHDTDQRVRCGMTETWSKERPWLAGTPWHILMPRARSKYITAPCPKRSQNLPRRNHADFDRLTRRIWGRSIALVLGGGGARGISHLGLLKALEERGIPVDLVGGTSIGAYIGAVYARELNFEATFNIVKHFCLNLSPWRFILDVTYPWLSLTTGRRFNYLIRGTFGDMDLNDTWLEYYCATTRFTFSGASLQIFTKGSAWELIRASMTFMGFVPPICRDGELLLDGCYSSNIPISFATTLKAGAIFAVDVTPDRPMPRQLWTDELSAWRMLWKRFAPSGDDPPRYSAIMEVLCQGIACADLETTRHMTGCFYSRMPVGEFRGLEFSKFDQIFQVGYDHATQWLDGLERTGQLQQLFLRSNCVSPLS